MKKLIKTAAALILSAIMMIPQGGFSAAASAEEAAESVSKPVITGYSITSAGGRNISSINQNTKFNIQINFRDLGFRTSDINGAADIDFVKSLDSFEGRVELVTLSSADDSPLAFSVKLQDCIWLGGSSDFSFMLGYFSKGSNYTEMSANITQCVGQESSGGSSSISEPLFRITAEESEAPIKAGDEGSIEFTIKNLGPADVDRILVDVTATDDILITDGTDSHDIKLLFADESDKFKVSYKAADKITAAKQSFTITLRYSYDNGMGDASGSTTETVNLTSEITPAENVYPIVLSEFSYEDKVINPDDDFDAYITLKNIGTADMKDVFLSLTGNGSFVLTEGTSSAYIPLIAKGESKEIRVRIKALGELEAIRQELSVNARYTYVSDSEEHSSTYEKTFNMFAPIAESSAPLPVMTLKSLPEPIEGGAKYRYYVNIENRGGTDMENIRLTLKGSDSVIIVDSTDIAFVDKIAAGGNKSVKFYFMTTADISASNQYVSADITYNYTSAAGKLEQGDCSAQLSVDAKLSGAPELKIFADSSIPEISEDSEYEYTVTVKNLSDRAVRNLAIDFTCSEALFFVEGTDYAFVESIAAGASAQVTVKFRTMEEISSVRQTITADMSYVYGRIAAEMKGEAQSTINIIAEKDDKASGCAAPNIIIRSYDMGAEQIAAGDTFDLSLSFYNTSSVTAVENLIMTVNAGGDLTIYGGGNTYFYPTLSAKGELNEAIPLRALATAATGTSTVSIGFKYDYLDGEQRNTVTGEQTIFVPIYQPDKMTFDVQPPTYSVFSGNETYINVSYLNKGRSDIGNVKAEIVGDVGALSTSKIIGNVLPGGNGSFDFIVIPYMAGECSFTIRFTYEDATLTEVIKEVPVTFLVEEMVWIDPGFNEFPMTMEGEGESDGFPWLIVWIAAGVLVVGGVIVIICVVRHKKKKKSKLTEADIDWEDDLEDLGTVLSDKTKV